MNQGRSYKEEETGAETEEKKKREVTREKKRRMRKRLKVTFIIRSCRKMSLKKHQRND